MTDAGLLRVSLSDGFDLPLSRETAFPLFTARGEMRWVEGWHPEFFVEVPDDTEVGTVFRTRDSSHRATTWVVVARVAGERIRYARIEDGGSAGTVTVDLADAAYGCRVTVAYDLTATDPRSREHLDALSRGYAEYLASWRDAIVAHIIDRRPL